MRKAIVNQDGDVVNIIEVEDDADWSPPDGTQLVVLPEDIVVSPGDSYVNGEWVQNPDNYHPTDPLLEE